MFDGDHFPLELGEREGYTLEKSTDLKRHEKLNDEQTAGEKQIKHKLESASVFMLMCVYFLGYVGVFLPWYMDFEAFESNKSFYYYKENTQVSDCILKKRVLLDL